MSFGTGSTEPSMERTAPTVAARILLTTGSEGNKEALCSKRRVLRILAIAVPILVRNGRGSTSRSSYLYSVCSTLKS
jgi:hypothetical protein